MDVRERVEDDGCGQEDEGDQSDDDDDRIGDDPKEGEKVSVRSRIR